MEKDLRTRAGLTFEITPPFAADAYKGWWISVYSEKALNDARASQEDLKQITVSSAAVGQGQDPARWSSEELKLVRRVPPTVISFYSKDLGEFIENAEVTTYVKGVSLVWRDAKGSSGVLKLADLPEALRFQFGYDADKAKAADQAEAQERVRARQEALARAAEYAQPAPDPQTGTAAYSYASPSGGGGSVYVRGYMRSNGTYVNSYVRSSGARHR